MYLQVMEGSLILLRFLGIFIHFIDEYSCLKYCIFTKLSQMVCLINMYILKCQHAKCDCLLWKVLWFHFLFLRIFHTITTCLKRYNFIKLLQNVCLINTHILIYWHARCNCQLWKALGFYYVFGYFHTLLTSIVSY